MLLFFLTVVFVDILEFEGHRASGSSTTIKKKQQLNNRDRETYALLDIGHNEWLLCPTVASRFLYVFFFAC